VSRRTATINQIRAFLIESIPLVVTADDMIREGLVGSLSHPGGNITGISILATELDGKRLELLAELVPGARRVAVLVDPGTTPPDEIDALTAIARSQGIELGLHRAGIEAEMTPAIAAAQATGAQAIDVLASALFNAKRATIITQIAKAKLPGMYQWPEYGRARALTCYGPSIEGFYRQAARLIAKIFQGGQACRFAGRAAKPHHSRDQLDRRKDAGADGAAIAARPRR